MKVGIDGMLLSGTFSGVEQYIYNLCRVFSKDPQQLDVTVFVPRGFASEYVKNSDRFKLKKALISGRIRSLRIFWEQIWFPFKVFSYGFDLFHFPGYIHPYIKGMPTVLTVHDIISILAPELCKKTNKYYYGQFLRKSLTRAVRIIVPTERVKYDLWKNMHTPKVKIDVIPMGTDIASFEDAPASPVRELYGIGEEPYILFVGNIEPKKGISLLIRAVFAAIMHRKYPHKLVIAGKKGWKYKHVFRLVNELGEEFCKKRVIFTGYVPRKDLYSLYKEAQLFVFPSLIEGFGIPPLEAMACETPVLLSKEPALKETYDRCAHFFKNGDLKDLREHIEALLDNDSLRNTYVQKGKELADTLTWKKCIDRTIQTYKRTYEEFNR